MGETTKFFFSREQARAHLPADTLVAQRELDKMQKIILLDLFDMANVLTYRTVFYPNDFVREMRRKHWNDLSKRHCEFS